MASSGAKAWLAAHPPPDAAFVAGVPSSPRARCNAFDAMDRVEIIRALTALGEVLAERGVRGEMYLVGGAAIALAYDSRRSTRDIDAVFEPK